jgi:dUTP pyrophosphatase
MGFRGEIGIILINFSDDVFEIAQGDRIAQAVLSKVNVVTWNSVSDLTVSERGKDGFGSTGVKN